MHQAKKMERQLETKHSYKKTFHYDTSRGKGKSKKEGSSSPKKQGSNSTSGKHVPNLSNSSTSRTSSIKCLGKRPIALHCPNKENKSFEGQRGSH